MRKKVRRFAHLLLAFIFLTTTMPWFSGPARADASVALSSLQAGTGVLFAGYQWIVVDPATGYLLKSGSLPFQLQYDPSGNTSFASAGIRTYLNGTSSTDVNTNFLGSLPAADRSIILDHPWTTGPNGNESSGTVTCKIGLMSLSEYMGYTSNHTYFGIISFSHGPGSEWWTRTPCTSPIGDVFAVNGQLGGYSYVSGWEDIVGPIYYHEIRPALYLSPTTSISLTSGGDLSVISTLGEAGTSAVTAGSPTVPAADGIDSTTITVTLKDANGNALSSHTVDLAPSSGSHSVITPASGSAGSSGASVSGTTDSNGQAVFTVTNIYAETVTYTATDITSYGTNATYTYIPYIQASQQAQVSFGNANDIVSYGFVLSNENDTIDSASHTVAVTVPYETDLTSLTAHFAISYGATAEVNSVTQVSGSTANNFTSPVIYAVTAQDGITEQDWIVTVTREAPSTADSITAFSLSGANGTIDSTAHTVAVTVPYGTDLTNQAATFSLSPWATATVNGLPQVSGTTVNDFTGPVTYKVTAQDGSTEQDWIVTVQQGPGLTGITPDRGLTGSSVTLSGSSFGSVAGSVYFQQAGNNYVAGVNNWSDTSVQATVPADLQPGSVSVSVCNSVYGLTSNWLAFGVIPPEPTISPGGGIYAGSQNVTIGNVASWDTAYYTTDGTSPVGAGDTPGSSAVAYGGSFAVSQSETVKAAVYDSAGGWSSVAGAQFTFNSPTSPAAATFDLGPGSADNKDVPVTVTWNGNTLTDIRNGGATLTLNTDYTVSGNVVTILKSYLGTLSVGTATLTFDFSAGSSSTLDIAVKNTAWNNLVWTVPGALSTAITASLPVDSSGAYTGSGDPPGTSGQGSLEQTGPVPATPVRLYVLKNGQPVTSTDIQVFMLHPSGKWYNVPTDGYGAAGGFDLNTGLAAVHGLMPLSVVVVATDTAAGGKYQLAVGTPGPDGVSLNTVVSKSSDITLTVTGGGGSGGGGGGGGGGNGSLTYYATVSQNRVAQDTLPVAINPGGVATVNTETIKGNIFNQEGNTVITVPSVPNTEAYTLKIPAASLSGTQGEGRLTFSTEMGSITITGNMLAETVGGGKEAGIIIGQGDKKGLPEAVQAAIGDRPLIQLSLTIDGKQTDWNNSHAPATVSIPYTPTAAELANSESIVLWHIDGAGRVVAIPNGHYDPVTGTVTFTVTHFSDYAVAYSRVSFNDVAASAWYYKAVSFIAAREITKGTGNGNYSPEARLTRGEFIVLMMRSYGIAPDGNPQDNFSDAGSTYYTGYLASAKRLGISPGVGGNLYAPGREITRQEMFTLLYNALKVIGQLPQGHSQKTLSDFTDAGRIDSWAKEALTLLVETGTVSGNDGKLAPLSTTTRAEMAQVLCNLLGR